MKSTDAYFLPAEFAHMAIVTPLVAKVMGQSENPVSGKAALRDYFASGLQAYLTLRFNFMRLYSGVRSWVVECHSVHGLRTAERMEFGESGKVRRVLAHYRDEALGGSPVWSAP